MPFLTTKSTTLGRKFLVRQQAQIKQFGAKKECVRLGVTDEMLDTFTPFRRTSNKMGELSDPEYFIKQFEAKMTPEYLPKNWAELSVAEKVDYIVKDRYQSLVSHKIMSKIQNEEVEHCFGISKNGEIVTYDTGGEDLVEANNFVDYIGLNKLFKMTNLSERECAELGTMVHNHPNVVEEIFEAGLRKLYPDYTKEFGSTFSGDDLFQLFLYNLKGRLVDSLGHRFSYTPKVKCTGNIQLARGIRDYVNANWVQKEGVGSLSYFTLIGKLMEYKQYISNPNHDMEVSRKMASEITKMYHKALEDENSIKEMLKFFKKDFTMSKIGKFEIEK